MPIQEEPSHVLARTVAVPAEQGQLRATVSSEPVKMARLSGVQLKEMATSGGFEVDESTGNRMIQALEASLDSLESRWAELEKLQQNPPMSESPAARWVARHMVNTAADADGLLTQLRAARAEFPTYVEAIELAKRTYQEKETSIGQEFKGIRNRIEPGEA